MGVGEGKKSENLGGPAEEGSGAGNENKEIKKHSKNTTKKPGAKIIKIKKNQKIQKKTQKQ